jgi:hypothetical protein
MTELELIKRDKQALIEQQAESITLFKLLAKQVGITHGQMIDEHIASLAGRRFNPLEWDFQDRNGEQGR